MAKSTQKQTRDVVQIRMTGESREQLEYLKRQWGGITPTTQTGVIHEAIRRAFEAEKKSEKKSQKTA